MEEHSNSKVASAWEKCNDNHRTPLLRKRMIYVTIFIVANVFFGAVIFIGTTIQRNGDNVVASKSSLNDGLLTMVLPKSRTSSSEQEKNYSHRLLRTLTNSTKDSKSKPKPEEKPIKEKGKDPDKADKQSKSNEEAHDKSDKKEKVSNDKVNTTDASEAPDDKKRTKTKNGNTYYDDDEDPTLSVEDTSNENDRPIMHTFFERVAQGEKHLVKVWSKEWRRIGFQPKVLTLADAESHPYYEEMREKVMPLWGNKTYNGMCFYRWLAMANAGGGWMSDYDTFPTNFPMEEATDLPNDGNFTSFQSHVPCLLSGSADEWIRVTKELVDAIPRINDKVPVKSDMYAFLQLRGEKNHSIHFLDPDANVARGYLYVKSNTSQGDEWKVACEEMRSTRAAHLSHHATHLALEQGSLPIEGKRNAMYRRGEAAKAFMKQWRDQCLGAQLEIQ